MASDALNAAYYGGFNGIVVTGKDSVYAGNWFERPYLNESQEGYSDI
jgi:hypothetical protein